jgi:uncharacterized protein (TIGR03905 family)
MDFTFTPRGVCSKKIEFSMDGDTIGKVKFTGGCHGNLQGIAALAEGMKAEDFIARCKGICCGYKSTSCPDQFAHALEQALEEMK